MSVEKFETGNKKNEKDPSDTLAKQQAVTTQIEQFYKKPATHEEMVENMRILKEIPEDASDPKVVIKLGGPEKSHKFVLMEDEDNRQYVIALPIDKKGWHAEIANFSRKLYKKDIHAIGGGYIHAEEDKLIVDGTSGSYGEAPKEIVREILQKKFPNIEIEAHSLADHDAKKREEEYKKTLESMGTVVQKELYAEVLDRKSVKLGYDYTSKPKNIEGSDDFAYMTYSSENGSSFGFDTVYLGYKNKSGEIKSKEVVRERWYVNINEIKIEDTNIVIKYTTNDEENIIKIPLEGIENFEMISNLSETEEQLVKMYKDNQAVYKEANIYHAMR